jgi:hypothetical protein
MKDGHPYLVLFDLLFQVTKDNQQIVQLRLGGRLCLLCFGHLFASLLDGLALLVNRGSQFLELGFGLLGLVLGILCLGLGCFDLCLQLLALVLQLLDRSILLR